MDATLRCRLCHHELVYLHGHAACVSQHCPMHGVSQADCCDGETAESSPVPTSAVAALDHPLPVDEEK